MTTLFIIAQGISLENDSKRNAQKLREIPKCVWAEIVNIRFDIL